MPGREESCLVPGVEASWGHLGRRPKRGPEGTEKRTYFWVGFGGWGGLIGVGGGVLVWDGSGEGLGWGLGGWLGVWGRDLGV